MTQAGDKLYNCSSLKAKCFHPRYDNDLTLFIYISFNWLVPGINSLLDTISKETL